MHVLFVRKKSTCFWISRNYKKILKKQRFSHFLSIFLIFCKVLYDCITKNIKNKNIYRCSDDAKSNKCCFFYNFKDHYFNCKLIFFMIFFVKRCSFLHYKNNLTFQNKSVFLNFWFFQKKTTFFILFSLSLLVKLRTFDDLVLGVKHRFAS